MCIYLHTFHMEKLNGQYLCSSFSTLLVVGTTIGGRTCVDTFRSHRRVL